MRIHDIPRVRMLWIVTMKLMTPNIEESVMTWIARIHRSWPFPCAATDSGG